MDYFSPHMSLNEVNAISMLGLAHIGDGVYELLTRTMLCTQGHSAVQKLHRLTVSYVNAPAQAAAMQKILPKLTEAEYHSATGLEALFGWLYLQGQRERIDELFEAIMEEEN